MSEGVACRAVERTPLPGSLVAAEIADQPAAWRRAATLAPTADPFDPGVRTALVGCGSSWHAAGAIAALREQALGGETDAYPASEASLDRAYGRVIAISRSGQTSELLSALQQVPPDVETVAIVGDPASRVAKACAHHIDLSFADDRSVVQTRFVTTVVALARAALGTDLEEPIADAQVAIEGPLALEPGNVEHLVFLGQGWCVPIAHAAALAAQEIAQLRTEAHPAMEYRHGPIATAGPGTVAWFIGPAPDGLAAEIEATGATVLTSRLDPLAELVHVQRLGLLLSQRRGLDADHPPNLTRAVVLDAGRPEEIVG
jgi:fructoselysine-6-P-deglycase FrlB-like protein